MLIFIQKLNMCCLHTKEENIPNNPPRKILAFKYTENIAQMHAAFVVKYAKLKCVTPKSLKQIDIKYSYEPFLMLFNEKKNGVANIETPNEVIYTFQLDKNPI